MIILQIAEALLLRMRLIIGIHIAVRGLSALNQGDGAVHGISQCAVRLYGKLIRGSLQPLIEVAVLKDHAVVRSLADAGRDAEIFDTVTGLGICKAIVQCFPLVGKHLGSHQIHALCEKTVGYTHAVNRQRIELGYHSEYLALSGNATRLKAARPRLSCIIHS